MITPRIHSINQIHFLPTLILCLICFSLGCLFQRMNQVATILTNQSLLEDAVEFPSFGNDSFHMSKKVQSHSKRENKNLVVINSLGRKENVKLAVYNKVTHFPSETWSCVAFIHANDMDLPESNKHLQKLQDPRRSESRWSKMSRRKMMIILLTVSIGK